MAATGRWGAVRPNVAFSGLARLRRVKPQPKLFQAPGPARSGHRCLFYARATAADEESESSPVVQEVDGKLLSLSPDDVSAGAARYAAVIEPPLYTRPSTEEELHQLRSAVGGGSAATQLVEFEEPTNFGEDAVWGGSKVSVHGSFNDWQQGIELERGANGNFVASLTLVPGHYVYKYRVDNQWRVSLREPVVVDKSSNQNNAVTVADTVTYRWQRSWGGKEIYVVGSESNWLERYKLEQVDGIGDFILRRSLPVGTYQYKFVVDGRWRVSPDDTVVRDSRGELNNQVTVAADATVTIFYKTGWTNPRLVVVDTTQPGALPLKLPKPQGNGDAAGAEQSPYEEVPFSSLPRGLWKTVSLPAFAASLGSETCAIDDPSGPSPATAGEVRKPALEFIVTDGKGLYDLAPGGGTYKCPWPGGYKLENGRLMAFPRAKTPPIMLVSDLDGTMVGQTPEFDAATRAFKRYWDDSASLAGSVLVYSTGRSIGQVMSLFKEKQGALAVPDAIVTAVGTKIFLREAGSAEGEWCWREDETWKAQLDEGWDLVPVKAACQAVINAHDGRVQWLDQGSEHPHRVAVSVAVEAVEAVQARLAALFASAQVDVQIIVSGEGAWRYVDCVAARGGKQESLLYLRKHFGTPLERTVAAGDSGNDVLMLGGKHRALIVGNAQPDLLSWHLAQPQTGRCVLTDAHGAMGILEGLARLQLY